MYEMSWCVQFLACLHHYDPASSASLRIVNFYPEISELLTNSATVVNKARISRSVFLPRYFLLRVLIIAAQLILFHDGGSLYIFD